MFKVSLTDDYELMDGKVVLGRGGDGGVLRGIKRKSGEWHAIKFVSTKGDDHIGAREKAAMNRLAHPHVAKLLAYYAPTKSRPRAALVMPEADFTLHDYIQRSR